MMHGLSWVMELQILKHTLENPVIVCCLSHSGQNLTSLLRHVRLPRATVLPHHS